MRGLTSGFKPSDLDTGIQLQNEKVLPGVKLVQKKKVGPEQHSEEQMGGVPIRDMAVALRYNQEQDNAPKIVASGRGLVAKKILEQAREHGVPVQENPEVAQLLAGLEIGQEVPPELYGVIAEVLAFVYSLDSNRRRF